MNFPIYKIDFFFSFNLISRVIDRFVQFVQIVFFFFNQLSEDCFFDRKLTILDAGAEVIYSFYKKKCSKKMFFRLFILIFSIFKQVLNLIS